APAGARATLTAARPVPGHGRSPDFSGASALQPSVRKMRGRRRLAGVLATVALAAGMTLAGTGTARADIIPPVAQWAEIYSPYLNGQGFSVCFDDPSGSTASGTVLQLFHCHGYASNGAPQRWVFIQPEDSNGNLIYDDGHPIYEIYSSAGGLCLTAPNLAVGTQLTLGTCN